jgi:hypothetical protein
LSKNKVEEMEKYFSGDLKKEKDLYVTTLKNLPETPYYE